MTLQAQTLLWAREQQLGRLMAVAEGRQTISKQVCGPSSRTSSRGLRPPAALTHGEPMMAIRVHQLLCRSLRALTSKSCAVQVMFLMAQALRPAVAASDGLLSGVAAGHDLPVLTGIVELYAGIEALQVSV